MPESGNWEEQVGRVLEIPTGKKESLFVFYVTQIMFGWRKTVRFRRALFTPLRCLVKKYESVSHSVMSDSCLRAVDGSLPSSSVHGIF